MPSASQPLTPAVGEPRTTWMRISVTMALLVTVASPAWPHADDGFPLSTYPMFSYPRASTSLVETVVGVDAEGRQAPLTPSLVGGTSQVKQALSTTRRAINEGHADALCREVAARVARDERRASTVAIEVVRERWHADDAGRPGATPAERRVYAHCEVP